MRQFAMLMVAALSMAVASESFAQGVTYNPETGNITFTGLTNVGGLRVKGPEVPAIAPDALGGFADTTIPGEVSWLFFAPKAGDVDAGNLFPTGLFQAELESDYEAYYVVTGGGGAQVAMPIEGGIIPEPATLAMAGLGFIGLIAVRRRS